MFKSSLKSYVYKTFIYILEKINLLKSMGILHFDSMGLIKILLGDLSGATANDFFFFFFQETLFYYSWENYHLPIHGSVNRT